MIWAKDQTYSGWGRALSAKGDIAIPDTAEALRNDGPAIGNRRSYGDAPLNSGGKAIDMTKLDRIISFDRETGLLTVQAGITLGELTRVFAPQGWMPAVVPGTGFATVGGAIAMDVHGKNHHHAGSFCQHVTAITLIQDKPRKITPKTGALWLATCGGLGQTGLIAQATLQLVRTRGDMMLVTEQRASDWDEHLSLLDNSQAPYTVGWIDATATGEDLGRGIVEEGETCKGLRPTARGTKKVPFNAPHWALSSPIVKLFNAAYYRRVPKIGRTVVRTVQDFFFPLDKIHDWNKLYGKRGFHQFQCVVPLDQSEALRTIMQTIATSGLASPLAVLKRMGEGREGYLSFPMEGYTLAVDFPNRPAARALIKRLEAATLNAGGRLYLAKDALSTGAAIKSMYPEHSNWARAVAKADPEGQLQTDMTRRLDLRTPQ
ncbi:decaprenylphospho-beta-D-ribofuranose 2-oxidase [Octadecabacter temperatus]|uniref:Putative decaprenylphosphoryl-beta-D-ribose oxidase n=1 Tax=Octadecabacter temperatus TaxID=1458307 RepID=A0A0K0Y356_9RHOB|nr:FAD-binding oxidoreductase [Octadecabacter temperatus]AKS45302.1 putative decaprenylphosphoryl-beta-D-ribose oxidase [Octadecabacter temperatus]SIN90120.1 decaprenylphospho-beta-D-ribofuranose 2-oxidase [Octadecabacter temperatus]